MKIEERKQFLINVLFFSTVGVLIFLTIKFMLAYLLPFIIGLCIAFSARKIAKKLSGVIKIDDNVSAALITVILYVIVILLIFLLFWVVFSVFSDKIPNYFSVLTDVFSNAKQSLEKLFGSFSEKTRDVISNFLDDFFQNIISKTGTVISSAATNIIKNMPQFFISSIVTVTASFYIAKDYNKLLKFLKNMIKSSTYNNIIVIKDIFVESILKLCSGYLILSLITLVELIIGLSIIGVKHAVGLAVLIAIVDTLPVLGSGVIMVPWSVVAFLNSNLRIGFSILVLYVITIVVRNVLEPKIISKKIGINPLLTLLAIFLGFKLSGFLGMIMLPIALIITINFYKRQMAEEIDN